MCKIRVEGRISSTDETEFETQAFPGIRDLNITLDGKLARVVNGVVGYYLDVTGKIIAIAGGDIYSMNFSHGSLTGCAQI